MEARDLALREVGKSPWIQPRELAARLHEQTGLPVSELIRLLRSMEADGDLRSRLDGGRKTYALPEGAPAPAGARAYALPKSTPKPAAQPPPMPKPAARPQPALKPAARPQPAAKPTPTAEAQPQREPESAPVATPAGEPPGGSLWAAEPALAPPPDPAPRVEPAPGAQRPARLATKPGWPIAAVIVAVLAVAVVSAVLLSSDKRDPFTGASEQSSEPVPVASPPPPTEPTPAPANEPTPAEEPPASDSKPRRKPRPPANAGLAAAKTVTTAVLSGVAQPGVAAKEAGRLKRKGFRVGAVANAPAPAERSAVLYARGAKPAAKALAKRVGIRAVRAVDPATAAAARGAKLYLVVGAKP